MILRYMPKFHCIYKLTSELLPAALVVVQLAYIRKGTVFLFGDKVHEIIVQGKLEWVKKEINTVKSLSCKS